MAVFFFAKRYLISNFAIDYAWLKKLYQYGRYTFGVNISSMIMRNIDSWMLGGLLSPLAVAIYNPALRIANLFEIPATSLASIFFPQAVKRIGAEGSVAAKRLYEKSASYLFASILPFVIFVLIFSEPIVVLIAGEGYRESSTVLNITMLYGLILPFNRQLGVVLDAMGKAKLNLLFVIRNAAINTVLNYVAIQYYGTIGAAYATLSTFLISMMINQWYMRKYLDVEVKNYPKHFVEFYVMMYQLVAKKIKDLRA